MASMNLTRYEREVLALLSSRKGEVVSKRDIEDRLNLQRALMSTPNENVEPKSNVVEVLIGRIRRKEGLPIKAIRNKGYILREQA
jgi:DNA-binding response OmpR family regulator